MYKGMSTLELGSGSDTGSHESTWRGSFDLDSIWILSYSRVLSITRLMAILVGALKRLLRVWGATDQFHGVGWTELDPDQILLVDHSRSIRNWFVVQTCLKILSGPIKDQTTAMARSTAHAWTATVP